MTVEIKDTLKVEMEVKYGVIMVLTREGTQNGFHPKSWHIVDTLVTVTVDEFDVTAAAAVDDSD